MYQINIFEYMKNRDKPREINCKGLCDDPYCPKCDYEFGVEQWIDRKVERQIKRLAEKPRKE